MISKILDFFLSFFDQKSRKIFFSSVIIMLISHGFCFTNLMYSHDSLVFYDVGGWSKIVLGRWLYPFLVHRRQLATPGLMGALSILYVSFAVVIVAKTFDLCEIKWRGVGLSVAILFGTNITLISLFCTYINDADADCLGLLLACLAVYGFKLFPKIINIFVPAVLLTFCLALYQSYICVAAGLFVILLIYESSKMENWNDISSVLLYGVKELFTLILAVVLYIPSMYVFANHYDIALSTGYNGAGNFSLLTITDVFKAIPKAYIYFKDTFFTVTEYNTHIIVAVNWLMIIILMITILIYIISHQRFLGSLVIIIPCILLFPLALNSIYIVSFGTIHQLMIFAFCIVYMLPLVFISITDTCFWKKRLLKSFDYEKIKIAILAVTFCSIIVVGFNNAVFANGAYVHKKLVYDNTKLHAHTIWEDINHLEGYKEGETPVLFMGSFDESMVAYKSSVSDIYGPSLTGAVNSSITYASTSNCFYRSILGRDINISYDDSKIKNNVQYLSMPIYPQNGYCQMIGDFVVVKLSD